ncbi:MAG: hypothetical protein MUC60_10255 [Oscillatoria sp. Prado101]|nr:hypothetical protein [Oscillatoria sp. Prado101]
MVSRRVRPALKPAPEFGRNAGGASRYKSAAGQRIGRWRNIIQEQSAGGGRLILRGFLLSCSLVNSTGFRAPIRV